eukprot:228907-Chlamydomonas_euryale.AAC.1
MIGRQVRTRKEVGKGIPCGGGGSRRVLLSICTARREGQGKGKLGGGSLGEFHAAALQRRWQACVIGAWTRSSVVWGWPLGWGLLQGFAFGFAFGFGFAIDARLAFALPLMRVWCYAFSADRVQVFEMYG